MLPSNALFLEDSFTLLIRRYDIQHNDTHHKGLICDTQQKWLSA